LIPTRPTRDQGPGARGQGSNRPRDPGSGIRGRDPNPPGARSAALGSWGLRLIAGLACAVLATGCASNRPASRRAPARPLAHAAGHGVEEGLASWYGYPYHGRLTASGERYDMDQMTAAHRTLPFGTRVRVTNLDNGRHVTVTINDRGPFVAGRILDLSRAAATALDAIGPGVVRVRLEIENVGDGMPDAPCWEVQVGAFAEAGNARRARRRLEGEGFAVRFAPAGGGLTRVRVTSLAGRKRAFEVADRLGRDFPGAVAVPCGGGW
jgi:peptidoglycan lytic transglycosylase